MEYPDSRVLIGIDAAQLAPPEAVQVAGVVHDKPDDTVSLSTAPDAFDGPALATVMV